MASSFSATREGTTQKKSQPVRLRLHEDAPLFASLIFLSDCALVVLELEECFLSIVICEASVADRGCIDSSAASSSAQVAAKATRQIYSLVVHNSGTSAQHNPGFNVAVVKLC
ncbi:hypothetical protein B5807_00687 [Epicoccum nigrum]|jgi:hypothetical protein|uniref:Uncharacterized protein n=1 Tax=Epicoccum nigrum TaxID=105696 RepID=A0A1Y2MF03_EPING|nr:hypothetical protein B5807_00687 [Epicoccum nigrum]